MIPCFMCGQPAPDDQDVAYDGLCDDCVLCEEEKEHQKVEIVCQRGTPLLCGDCQSPMTLKVSDKWSHKNGDPKLVYICSRYPKCKGTHGAHPDGQPLGTPVDRETRQLRHMVHSKLFAKGLKHVRQHNVWLKDHGFGEGHVGAMNKQQCKRAIVALS